MVRPIFQNLTYFKQYKVFKNGNIYIDCDDVKNNTCVLKNGSIIVIENIVSLENSYYVIGFQYEFRKDLFTFIYIICDSFKFRIVICT